jgi:ATP-dependent Lon protease
MRRKRRNPSGYLETIRHLPIIALKEERVILPLGMPSKPPLWAARPRSINAVRHALGGDRDVLLLTQKTGASQPGEGDFYDVGAVASILEDLETPKGEIKIIVEAYARGVVLDITEQDEMFIARVRVIENPVVAAADKDDLASLSSSLLKAFEDYNSKTSRSPSHEDESLITNEAHPGQLADLVAFYCGQKEPNNLNLSYEQLQRVLGTLNVKDRIEMVLEMVGDLLEIIDIEEKLTAQVKKQVEKTQREYYLTEKLKAIQKELGRGVEGSDTEELRERIKEAKMTEEAEEKALKEVDRLDMMPPMSAESGVIRSYIDWMLALPWDKSTEVKIELDKAMKMLDEDHHGLKKVKERIVEYLAVMKLVERVRGPILCFVGPPGVGKTSLGRSIARATGREFVRMSLGGVRDEAEIRGHRRTYIGSIPGRILQGMRDAGAKNPLFLLDEVDKMSMDFRGDPSSALLEVLDPEQNSTFRDHYLDVAFDLSDVMFITTANVLPAIPDALRDRMEVIELPGYTELEKMKIAKHFLVPRQLEGHGLTKAQLRLTDGALHNIVQFYTREAGVRNLERELTKICRKVAKHIVSEADKQKTDETATPKPVSVSVRNIEQYLGPPRFLQSKTEKKDRVGVAHGLVYTSVGGDVITIEATKMATTIAEEGRLTLTGQLGEVMRESATTALSYLRSAAEEHGLEDVDFQKWDIHIHVPEGAVPKDGPSAGITLATAMLSALSNRRVRSDIAMTGEITLHGNILPIGGLKEKLLAAHRLGIDEILIPKDNEKDLVEIPADVRKKMTIRPVSHVSEVIRRAVRPLDRDPEAALPPAAEIPALPTAQTPPSGLH